MQDKHPFPLGSRVTVTEYGIDGIVDGIYYDRQGPSCSVRYVADNGVIESRYFLPEELAAR